MQLKVNSGHPRRSQFGVSTVELLVGAAVGLFIVAGATTLFVGHLNSSRRLLVEARVNQDLRSAADIVARDLRRAGFWENAVAGTFTDSSGASTTSNPNATVTTNTSSASANSITYSLARDSAAGRAANNNTLNTDEQFGFRLNSGTLQMQIGSGNWQSITDPGVLTVSYFTLAPTVTNIDIRDSCSKACCDAVAGTCTATNVAACPKVTVRSYQLVLSATATGDSAITRTIQEQIRVRNDSFSGSCPA